VVLALHLWRSTAHIGPGSMAGGTAWWNACSGGCSCCPPWCFRCRDARPCGGGVTKGRL